jgi:hypothetical protein
VGLASSIGLLARDEGMEVLPQLSRGAMTAMPLLSVGIPFLILQLMIRPRSVAL